LGRYHWPSFNVADMAITVGAISLFITMARQDKVEEASPVLPKATGQESNNLLTNETPAKEQAAEDVARSS